MQGIGSNGNVDTVAKKLAATRIAVKFDRVLAVMLGVGVGVEHGLFTGCAACFGLWLAVDVWARSARMEDSGCSIPKVERSSQTNDA